MYSGRLESHLSVWNVKHGEELKNCPEPSGASVQNRSDGSLSGAMLAFSKEERPNLEHNHAAGLRYQRELLELHELLHINPYLEVNFKCKKSWKYLSFSGFHSRSINL